MTGGPGLAFEQETSTAGGVAKEHWVEMFLGIPGFGCDEEPRSQTRDLGHLPPAFVFAGFDLSTSAAVPSGLAVVASPYQLWMAQVSPLSRKSVLPVEL
jgi:hypothetical protein